jgi:arylsulfatase A-like enzyme
LVPLLSQTGGLKRDAIYWHYPHYHPGGATPYSAVRQGDWKLIEFFEDNRAELYNLRDDIGENRNLAAADPQKTQSLRKLLDDWRKSVDAQLPVPNPNYDPTVRPTSRRSQGA